MLIVGPVRCGTGIQNWEPQHFRDHNPHNSHFKQPQSAWWSPYPSTHLRVSWKPRHGARENKRRLCWTPRPSSKAGTRAQEDQGRERVITFGGTVPDPRLWQRSVLRHHYCKRGENIQVRLKKWFANSAPQIHWIFE